MCFRFRSRSSPRLTRLRGFFLGASPETRAPSIAAATQQPIMLSNRWLSRPFATSPPAVQSLACGHPKTGPDRLSVGNTSQEIARAIHRTQFCDRGLWAAESGALQTQFDSGPLPSFAGNVVVPRSGLIHWQSNQSTCLVSGTMWHFRMPLVSQDLREGPARP